MRRNTQDGFVLTELLLVMVISLVLLSATLFTFERLMTNSGLQEKRNDTAELARRSLEIQARQLRNLAKRVKNQTVIAAVGPYDLVFQTSDPSRTWIRYCLDTSRGTNFGRVWEQTQSADNPGTSGSCGPTASGWATSRLVAGNVVNRQNGSTYPMFAYRCVNGGSSCTGSSATFDQIIGVDASLWVDTTPTKAPPATLVASGVFLRNQNQAPVAAWSSTVIPSTSRTVQLNGSGSSDPEARTLQYYWFLGTMPTASKIDCDDPEESIVNGVKTMWEGAFLSRGVTVQQTWPATGPASLTSQTIGLVVCDPGGRSSFLSKSVTIPQ